MYVLYSIGEAIFVLLSTLMRDAITRLAQAPPLS